MYEVHTRYIRDVAEIVVYFIGTIVFFHTTGKIFGVMLTLLIITIDNEIADELARKSSKSPMHGPEPAGGFVKNITAVEWWLKKKTIKHCGDWNQAGGNIKLPFLVLN